MKNSDSQELKPIYIHDTGFSADDEINLIDLAIVLIRRKIIIIAIFIICIVLGVTTALFTPKTYTYSTSIKIGSQVLGTTTKPFESPPALLAKLQHLYVPQTLIKHRQSYPNDKKTYHINSSVPSGGDITILQIENTEDNEDASKELLQLISQRSIQDHNRIYQSVKQNLQSRLNQATNDLKSLKISKNNQTEIATYRNIIESISTQLANLRKTTGTIVIKSLEPTGGGRKIIVIIYALAGLFLGIFSAFFAEFISKVKQRIREEGKA